MKKGIKHVHAKFTGSTGFHVGIPFESFPSVIEGNETKKLFPEMMREAGECRADPEMVRDLIYWCRRAVGLPEDLIFRVEDGGVTDETALLRGRTS